MSGAAGHTAAVALRRHRGGRARPAAAATRVAVIELFRRWPSVIFMVLMPLGYFLATYATSDATTRTLLPVGDGPAVSALDRDVKAVYLAVLGIGVTASFAAMTIVRPGGAALRRLRLVGFAAWHLLVARLVVLALICAISTTVFCAFFLPLVSVSSAPLAVAALLLVGLTGITLGTFVGLVVPREFEAAMILIAFAGMQMALGRVARRRRSICRTGPRSTRCSALPSPAPTCSPQRWWGSVTSLCSSRSARPCGPGARESGRPLARVGL